MLTALLAVGVLLLAFIWLALVVLAGALQGLVQHHRLFSPPPDPVVASVAQAPPRVEGDNVTGVPVIEKGSQLWVRNADSRLTRCRVSDVHEIVTSDGVAWFGFDIELWTPEP
ncbi:MAG: hypothetical protein ACRDZ4_04755 [Egibacteraceae bacterium]